MAVVFHIQHGPLDSVSGWYDLSLVTIATGVSCTACLIREGRAQRALARVRSVAEVAQRALLPPMPHRLGPVRLAIRYQPAAADACIGGDFYAAIPTPYGVRVIVGDARGKGLEAVELAATVLGTFRATTHDEPTLRSLARRLDSALERVRGELSDAGCPEPHEEFVTAVLLEINDDGTLEILNCGHEPPILLSASGPKLLDSEEPNLPLGQLTLAAGHLTTHNVPATYWHTLLLHTDGVTEARNRHGIFYPLIDRIPTCMRDNVDDTVGRLHDDLLHHADKHLSDDAVLLAIQREHDDSKTQAPIATTGKAA
ncbi:PP2C family protein-serine/threonine phosphatase [Streptomyces sp. NPDC052043]|uniref:PP2C family protein-serine/threonine phosphatase n=1 Tax=Streptomyces sp. NPDC052043 TaxID=3365684 RepID=UPI0037D6E4F0